MPLTAKQRAETLAAWEKDVGKCQGECGVVKSFLDVASPPFLAARGYDLAKNLFQVDHILPEAMGGGNEERNRQVLCQRCHREKTRVDVHEIRKGERIGRPFKTGPTEKIERLREKWPLARNPGR